MFNKHLPHTVQAVLGANVICPVLSNQDTSVHSNWSREFKSQDSEVGIWGGWG